MFFTTNFQFLKKNLSTMPTITFFFSYSHRPLLRNCLDNPKRATVFLHASFIRRPLWRLKGEKVASVSKSNETQPHTSRYRTIEVNFIVRALWVKVTMFHAETRTGKMVGRLCNSWEKMYTQASIPVRNQPFIVVQPTWSFLSLVFRWHLWTQRGFEHTIEITKSKISGWDLIRHRRENAVKFLSL